MEDASPIRSLVEDATRGNREAFEALLETYRTRLRAVVRTQVRDRGGTLDAEEVLQETAVRAFESLGRFSWQGDDSFYRWLCGIARRVGLKLLGDARNAGAPELLEQVPGSEVTASRALRRDERFVRLEEALAGLSPDYREVLRLSRLERLKVKEIAQRMGRSEYAVKHLLARAVRQLRDRFGDTESLHLPDRPLNLRGVDDARE